MTVYPWPSGIAPRGIAFNKRGMTVSGPPTLTGRTQIGQTDAGYWVAQLQRVAVAGPTKVKAFRSLIDKLEGGVNQVKVPVFDDDQVPWPATGGRAANAFAEQPFVGGKYFTTGHGFFRPAILVATSASAAIGATSIAVTVTTAGTITGGERFSISDRLYGIKSILSAVGSARTWEIWPRLREAVPSGARLNFDTPRCTMRLASEGDGDLALEYGRYGFPDVSLVEVF